MSMSQRVGVWRRRVAPVVMGLVVAFIIIMLGVLGILAAEVHTDLARHTEELTNLDRVAHSLAAENREITQSDTAILQVDARLAATIAQECRFIPHCSIAFAHPPQIRIKFEPHSVVVTIATPGR